MGRPDNQDRDRQKSPNVVPVMTKSYRSDESYKMKSNKMKNSKTPCRGGAEGYVEGVSMRPKKKPCVYPRCYAPCRGGRGVNNLFWVVIQLFIESFYYFLDSYAIWRKGSTPLDIPTRHWKITTFWVDPTPLHT